MPISTLELSLAIQLTGPMHIGAGFARGLVNRTVVRGGDGLVYLPGSTIKGKARDACESLARLHGLGDCPAPYPQAMVQNDHPSKCLVCCIFGAPARPSSLLWHSAALSDEWVKALRSETRETSRVVFGQSSARTQVQIDRTRGLTAEAHLFTSEFAAEGLCFSARPALTGRLRLTPITVTDEPDVYYELAFLLAGLKLISALGGERSRGAGQCQITLPETVLVDREEVSVERQLAQAEALGFYWDELEVQP
jgi:CRISPR/Cas system CSM-associated protein Csm3 (group 7 of RAMP superfamily)